jgi:hypothetical protein
VADGLIDVPTDDRLMCHHSRNGIAAVVAPGRIYEDKTRGRFATATRTIINPMWKCDSTFSSPSRIGPVARVNQTQAYNTSSFCFIVLFHPLHTFYYETHFSHSFPHRLLCQLHVQRSTPSTTERSLSFFRDIFAEHTQDTFY